MGVSIWRSTESFRLDFCDVVHWFRALQAAAGRQTSVCTYAVPLSYRYLVQADGNDLWLQQIHRLSQALQLLSMFFSMSVIK
jgi:hypothetical protein